MEEDFSRTEEEAASCCNHVCTAKTVWWRGNRYDVLGEDAHTLPVGGRILLRELESGPSGPRMRPYIRLGRYRGDVVEDHGGAMGPWLWFVFQF